MKHFVFYFLHPKAISQQPVYCASSKSCLNCWIFICPPILLIYLLIALFKGFELFSVIFVVKDSINHFCKPLELPWSCRFIDLLIWGSFPVIFQLSQIYHYLLKIRFFLVMESVHFAWQENTAILILNKLIYFCKDFPRIN